MVVSCSDVKWCFAGVLWFTLSRGLGCVVWVGGLVLVCSVSESQWCGAVVVVVV